MSEARSASKPATGRLWPAWRPFRRRPFALGSRVDGTCLSRTARRPGAPAPSKPPRSWRKTSSASRLRGHYAPDRHGYETRNGAANFGFPSLSGQPRSRSPLRTSRDRAAILRYLLAACLVFSGNVHDAARRSRRSVLPPAFAQIVAGNRPSFAGVIRRSSRGRRPRPISSAGSGGQPRLIPPERPRSSPKPERRRLALTPLIANRGR